MRSGRADTADNSLRTVVILITTVAGEMTNMEKRRLSTDEKREAIVGGFAVLLWFLGWAAIIIGASTVSEFAGWTATGIGLLVNAGLILRGLD